MPLPVPVPGLVIRYAYLWRHEHHRGRDEGVKDRPCAVVLRAQNREGEIAVTVAPITPAPPREPAVAVALTTKVRRHLGLDEQPSWIIADEVNRFVWPGPDLRPATADRFEYGILPEDVFDALRETMVALFRARRLKITGRTS